MHRLRRETEIIHRPCQSRRHYHLHRTKRRIEIRVLVTLYTIG